jgi:Uma2 family endonuclease
MYRHPRDLVTNAAESLPRRRFAVAELERMTEAGILGPDERIELIGGDIVVMSEKGLQHEILKTALLHDWSLRLPADTLFAVATTFRLSVDTYLEPDFVFFPRLSGIAGLSVATAKLVVEVADSSLDYDLGRKAALYAGFGIAELWVIEAVNLVAHIHCDPGEQGYRSVTAHAPGVRLVPQALPGLAATLGQLELYGRHEVRDVVRVGR